MTNKEVIKILKREMDNADPIVFPEVKEALDIAIKVLEQTDKIKDSNFIL